ncbi:ubiquitin C-terminal hydrolase Ubp14 [Coniothyrium glycines]
MGSKAKKRDHDLAQGGNAEEPPVKRRRQTNEAHLKLSKLYEDLAAESDEIRFEAAKELIGRFSPAAEPNAQEVNTALSRLIKGLCSQRKAARVGFSLTLTELLREIFGTQKNAIEGLNLDVASIIALIEEKTKVEGNVPGRERRDHLIGRLFGFKAVLQSSIILEPGLSLECWAKLLDYIYGMARDIPWLREECGMVLVEAVKSLKAQEQYRDCAKEIIARLSAFGLVSTPEGVAVWLTVQSSFEQVLPEGIWHEKDPLSRKERTRLAKILKENFATNSESGSSETTKSAAASPNPTFTWNIVLAEVLRRDTESKSSDKIKAEFPQFWIDTVDNNLFSSSSSHERKAWGFKLISSMVSHVPEWSISALLSPNLLRTLINQSKKDDRFLHSAALAALAALQTRVQQEPTTALPIIVALTGKHGSAEFDRITKTKTLEQILLVADNESLRRIVRHFNTIILRPETEEQVLADTRRQAIADLLLNTMKQFKRYDELDEDIVEKDSWIRRTLDLLVEHAYFVPNKSAKTNKVPLPPMSERGRAMFQERLSSCLSKLLDVDIGARSAFALLVIGLIKIKRHSSKSLDLAFKADDSILKTLDKATQTLDAIAAKGSVAGNISAGEGFVLLYALTILQVYNGDGDAVMLLDDLDTSRKALLKKREDDESDTQDPFVEIVLSFLGNPRTLFRKIGEEAFAIFAANVTPEDLQSLTDILDTEENLEGHKELFNQDGEENLENDGASADSDDQSETDKSSDDSSTSEDEDESEDDAELTQFDNLLAITLQTQKPNLDGDAPEESSDDSDMDDEQMMALDPHLSKIFKERSKTTSKKKEREDAKQNVVLFKSKVLDLLTIFLDKQYSNPLTLNVLLPVLRRTRANANKQTAEKAAKLLKTFFDTRTKRKAALPKPDTTQPVWDLLKEIHEEAKLGGGAKLHAESCSNASLFVAKVLIGSEKANYSQVVDIYAETLKQWFMDRKSLLQPVLFTQFQNWSISARQQAK